MGDRLYFPLNAATSPAPASPAYSAFWNQQTSVSRIGLSRTKLNSALTPTTAANYTDATATNPWNILHRQYISEAIPQAMTISGTFRAVIAGLEQASGADASLQVVVKAVSGDGATVRGVLYAGHSTPLSATGDVLGQEFATTRQPRVIPNGTALTPVVVQAGDRIVVELGQNFQNTVATTFNGSLTLGDPTTIQDFPLVAGGGNNYAPWIEFSQFIFGTVSRFNSGAVGPNTRSVADDDTGPWGALSGDPWNLVLPRDGSSIKYARSNSRGFCYEFVTTPGSDNQLIWDGLPAMTSVSVAGYVRWGAAPSAADRVWGFSSSIGAPVCFLARNPDRTLMLRNNANAAVASSTGAVATADATWYRIEQWYIQDLTQITSTWALYLGDSPTPLETLNVPAFTTTAEVAHRFALGSFSRTPDVVQTNRMADIRLRVGGTPGSLGPTVRSQPFLSLWDGQTEQPCKTSLWNGASEQPVGGIALKS